jgi:Asp-tRNA(Asn)/Glu-tRNA(Gln) amidotransferase A subunit family amidase
VRLNGYARGALFTAMARFHQTYDLLLTPALATPAFTADNLTAALVLGDSPQHAPGPDEPDAVEGLDRVGEARIGPRWRG